MAQEEKIFADGFIFKRNEKAPDFVVGNISIKVDDAIAFMRKHEKAGWVNLSTKQARSGNYYMELDTFVAKNDSAVDKYDNKKASAPNNVEDDSEDLPF